jgi:hypothetical protein
MAQQQGRCDPGRANRPITACAVGQFRSKRSLDLDLTTYQFIECPPLGAKTLQGSDSFLEFPNERQGLGC